MNSLEQCRICYKYRKLEKNRCSDCLSVSIKCRNCFQTFLKLNKSKKKLCEKCRYEKTILYTKKRIESADYDPCSYFDIYKIEPVSLDKKRNLRCHHVLHCEKDTSFEELNCKYEIVIPKITPVRSWNQIWQKCGNYFKGIDITKYCGKIKKGVVEDGNGNGIRAVVLTNDDTMYFIHGIW